MPTLQFVRTVSNPEGEVKGYQPVTPAVLLNGLLDILKACGTSKTADETVLAVLEETDTWAAIDPTQPAESPEGRIIKP